MALLLVVLGSRAATLRGSSERRGRRSLLLTADIKELVLNGLRNPDLLVNNCPLFLFLKSVNDLPGQHLFDLALCGSIKLIQLFSHLCLSFGGLRFLLLQWNLKGVFLRFLLLFLLL